jgi:transaldolase
MTKLHELHDAGQSVWLDFIKRDMLDGGELAQLVADGVRGLTSNPTIFQKALAGSDLYDAQIVEIVSSRPDASPAQVFEDLAVSDIRGAADALLPVYEISDGADGFVSLEVSPHLAHDTAGTVAEAKRLWQRVARPNLMIKVPCTPAGVPALEELIAEGINVNSTLMFSLESYIAIANAYVRGLERASDPSRIASVASFFVSRVDTKIDAVLDAIGDRRAEALRGTIAVANAKLAYRHYREIFGRHTFGHLERRGARPQRVLWASTSTKNPDYPDTMYVDDLIGPNTVNTLPPDTIDAFVDHGTIDPSALTSRLDEAYGRVDLLVALGIDFDSVTRDLQAEGVGAFAASYDDLLSTLSDKMARLAS